MDQEWNRLVEEGKAIAGRKESDQWHLGDLGARVETDYGKGSLRKYAEAIGALYSTLNNCRGAARAWPDQKTRPQVFSVAYALNRHPNRLEIVKERPNLTRDEARAEMKRWREAHPAKPGKQPKPAPLPAGPTTKRAFEIELEQRVADRIEDWMQKFKPHLDDAIAVKRARKGLVSKEEERAISRALHPDNSASPEMRNKAFIAWRRIAHLLTSEADSPTVISMPRRRRA